MAPTVLFLDEPTTGLDPRGRSEIWSAVRSLAGEGTTVLPTTLYLDEADRLAGQRAWPRLHPVLASVGWMALLLVIFVPLTAGRYART